MLPFQKTSPRNLNKKRKQRGEGMRWRLRGCDRSCWSLTPLEGVVPTGHGPTPATPIKGAPPAQFRFPFFIMDGSQNWGVEPWQPATTLPFRAGSFCPYPTLTWYSCAWAKSNRAGPVRPNNSNIFFVFQKLFTLRLHLIYSVFINKIKGVIRGKCVN